MDPDSKAGRQPPDARNGNARRLQVTVTDGRGRSIRDGGLSHWLVSIAPAAARGEVAIALVSDAQSQQLNSRYRRTRRPTDVLSFPARTASGRRGDPQARAGDGIPDPRRRLPPQWRFLGDVVIATGIARKQASAAGHSYQTELRVLALHGLLHLLGYDHENRDDAGRMRRIETRLRRRGGLATGLIERS